MTSLLRHHTSAPRANASSSTTNTSSSKTGNTRHSHKMTLIMVGGFLVVLKLTWRLPFCFSVFQFHCFRLIFCHVTAARAVVFPTVSLVSISEFSHPRFTKKIIINNKNNNNNRLTQPFTLHGTAMVVVEVDDSSLRADSLTDSQHKLIGLI